MSGGIGTSFDGEPFPTEQFALGGPMRMSAFSVGEQRGDHFVQGSFGYFHQLMRLPDFLGGPVFAGGWFEVGSAFNHAEDAEVGFHTSGAVILDTLIGPMFAGLSFGADGNRATTSGSAGSSGNSRLERVDRLDPEHRHHALDEEAPLHLARRASLQMLRSGRVDPLRPFSIPNAIERVAIRKPPRRAHRRGVVVVRRLPLPHLPSPTRRRSRIRRRASTAAASRCDCRTSGC